MIVLDASVVLEILLTAEGPSLAASILERSRSLNGPELLDLEVIQVLRRYTRTDALSARRASMALDDLRELPIVRFRHEPLLERIWQLRGNVSAYDGAYVALTELLDATLLTRDVKLASSPGHDARIELI